MKHEHEITEAMIDAEIAREDGALAPSPTRPRRNWIPWAIAGIAIIIAVVSVGFAALKIDYGGDQPEPFTIKADVSMSFSGVSILTMTPEDCDSVRTKNGTWKTSEPVIFRQGDSEIGTGTVTSTLDDVSSVGLRMCEYTIIGKVTPKDDSKITAELSDGYEWSDSVDGWKNPNPFLYQSGLTTATT